MFTKNFMPFAAANMFGGGTANLNCMIVKTDGTRQGYFGSGTTVYKMMSEVVKSTTGSLHGVIFTNGTTPPTPDDLTYTGTMLTNYTCAVTVGVTQDENGAKCTGLYTITNAGDTDFTVSEICLFSHAYKSSTNNSGYFMLERTVLEEPVTLPPNGVAVITYTIRLNFPPR